MYHRKDGRLVKQFDDLLSATRYRLMMLRFARTEDQVRGRSGGQARIAHGVDYDPLEPQQAHGGGQRSNVDLTGVRLGRWGAIRPTKFQ